MGNINKVIVSGRLTRDAEVNQLQSGTFAIKFSLASSLYMGKAGDYSNFFDCTYFTKSAKIADYLRKGQAVLVEAKAKQERWEKDGHKNSKVVFIVDKVELCGGGGKDQNTSAVADKFNGETISHNDFFSDDIPF